jgi:hypothetical protein
MIDERLSTQQIHLCVVKQANDLAAAHNSMIEYMIELAAIEPELVPTLRDVTMQLEDLFETYRQTYGHYRKSVENITKVRVR